MTPGLILLSLREAIVTTLAALVTMACALALDAEPGPAILAVVLCLSLSRSQLDRDLRGRIEAAVTLPIVSVAALGVGVLLMREPWLGAAVFVTGLSLPIWLRRFGPALRRAGSLVALPFVVLLVTPHIRATRVGPTLAWLVPIFVAFLALLWVSVFHAAARRLRWLPPLRSAPQRRGTPTRPGSLRPVASTRMAIQMAAALASAFVVGYVFFGQHWAWIVLTAYIVGSGNQGRLDVAYKSVLRVVGAAAGTVLALTFTLHLGTHDTTTVALILAAVFFGIWLRPLGYAWWALFVTLALALLQGFEGTSVSDILLPRLEEIVIGALIGVTAAWFLWPVRSTDVLRRRIADALSALSDALDPERPIRAPHAFEAAVAQSEHVAPAFRALRWSTRRLRTRQPADWIDLLSACRVPALALIAGNQTSTPVRAAVGTARKAMRTPDTIGPALENLRDVLLRTSTRA